MSGLVGKTLGSYKIIGQIGQGGMAVVYKGHDPAQDRIVAIKVLTPLSASDPEFVRRFQREARVLMKLRHPNIVPLEDFGEVDGMVYLVMPYYGAGSLAERVARRALTPSEGARLLNQVSSALECAHQQGIVHRDVKPSNILLDEEGNAFLADFGLAHVADASVSLTGSSVLGTPAYVSPEQVRGDEVDARTDQYSLGVVLFQLATGRLPFEADTPVAMLVKHVNEEFPAPRLFRPSIPETIERVILKATAKNPEDRFPSVTAMNEVFQAALAHALDPKANRAPAITLKAPVPPARPAAVSRRRSKRLLLAGAALAVPLLLFACPIGSSTLMDLLASVSGPAEGSTGPQEDASGPQLTAMARTIEAMSTEIVAARSDLMEPGQVQTAVMQTLMALYSPTPESEPSGTAMTPTPTPNETSFVPGGGGTVVPRTRTPTPTRTTAPPTTAVGPSLTPTFTPTPTITLVGPSPTATFTPTCTFTRTPSRTPTPTPTVTPKNSSTPTKEVATPTLPAEVVAIPTDTVTPNTEGSGDGMLAAP